MIAVTWLWMSLAAVAAFYLAFVIALLVAGRRSDARALAGFVPDCAVLFGRVLRDSRVSRGRRLVLGVLVVYLASPIDLVPDFVPVAGQLDDAILVALALRTVLRGIAEPLVREHWPGPDRSLKLMLRLAAGPTGAPMR